MQYILQQNQMLTAERYQAMKAIKKTTTKSQRYLNLKNASKQLQKTDMGQKSGIQLKQFKS